MDVGFDELLQRVKGHHFWLTYLSDATQSTSPYGLHLGVFTEPYLSMILSGTKTINSQFSRNRCAPYKEISNGDVILLKKVGGPICGLALARRIWFYELGKEPIDRIRHRFGSRICAGNEFWSSRANSNYATLIELDTPTPIAPVNCHKRDRRGWVSLRARQLVFHFG